jgi:hypothetical protein
VNQYITPNKIEFTLIENIDYKSFKMFLLINLWRASISKREFLRKLKLAITKKLLENDIKREYRKSNNYPILLWTYLHINYMN